MKPKHLGKAQIPVPNCTPFEVHLARDDMIGYLENIEGLECHEIKPDHINAIAAQSPMAHKAPQVEDLRKVW
jgi:hypothetical protein